MAQGKPFTKEQRTEIVNSLRSYLELGFSRNSACEQIGLTPQTLSLWIKADEALLMKVKGWENSNNKLALANILDAIKKEAEMEDPRKETTKWWLERKMKGEFSTRTEQTGANGEALIPDKQSNEKAEEAIASFLNGRHQDKGNTKE